MIIFWHIRYGLNCGGMMAPEEDYDPVSGNPIPIGSTAPVATVIMQTYYGEESRRARDTKTGQMNMSDSDAYKGLINTCVGYDEDGPIVQKIFPNGIH